MGKFDWLSVITISFMSEKDCDENWDALRAFKFEGEDELMFKKKYPDQPVYPAIPTPTFNYPS